MWGKAIASAGDLDEKKVYIYISSGYTGHMFIYSIKVVASPCAKTVDDPILTFLGKYVRVQTHQELVTYVLASIGDINNYY